MKGFYIDFGGNIYKGTKHATLALLKGIATGNSEQTQRTVEGLTKVGPVAFDLAVITPEQARELFTDISLGRVGETE